MNARLQRRGTPRWSSRTPTSRQPGSGRSRDFHRVTVPIRIHILPVLLPSRVTHPTPPSSPLLDFLYLVVRSDASAARLDYSSGVSAGGSAGALDERSAVPVPLSSGDRLVRLLAFTRQQAPSACNAVGPVVPPAVLTLYVGVPDGAWLSVQCFLLCFGVSWMLLNLSLCNLVCVLQHPLSRTAADLHFEEDVVMGWLVKVERPFFPGQAQRQLHLYAAVTTPCLRWCVRCQSTGVLRLSWLRCPQLLSACLQCHLFGSQLHLVVRSCDVLLRDAVVGGTLRHPFLLHRPAGRQLVSRAWHRTHHRCIRQPVLAIELGVCMTDIGLQSAVRCLLTSSLTGWRRAA